MVSWGGRAPIEHARRPPGAQPQRPAPRGPRRGRTRGAPRRSRCRTIVAMSLQALVRPLRSLVGAFPLSARGLGVGVLCAGSLRVWGYGSLDLVVFALAVTGLALLV